MRLFLLANVVLVLVYLADVFLGHPSPALSQFLDLDGEANLPTWYASVQLFLVAVLLALFGHTAIGIPCRRDRWIVFLSAAIFLVLSVDEIVRFHEWLGREADSLLPSGERAGTPFRKTGIWMLILAPPLIALFVLIYRGARELLRGRPHVRRRYVEGLGLYLGAAVGLEFFSNFVTRVPTVSVAQIVLEEFGEMLGTTLVLWATYDLLLSYQLHLPTTPPAGQGASCRRAASGGDGG